MVAATAESLGLRVEQNYQRLCRRRDPWKTMYSLLSKYILMRPVYFGDMGQTGQYPRFSVAGVSDDEVIEAARTSATAIGGALWPHAGESFELVPAEDRQPSAMFEIDMLDDSSETKAYAEQVLQIVRDVIDAPESGFYLAWSEYLDDQVVYGTSGIYGIEDDEDDTQPISFRSVSVETSVIDENGRGVVDTAYLEYCFTVRQLVDMYGEENVSQHVKDCYKSEIYDDWIRVVQAIEPRRGAKKFGKASAEKDLKPYASIHMEVETKHILKNDGMDELPVFVTRFRKRPNELYGRSLGMDALPTVKELNILRRGFTVALDKILRPPIGFYSEMIGGAGTVDISAGGQTALYNNGRIPQGAKPVETLLQLQEPRVASERMTELNENVRVKFLVDKLLDFNNKTRMTLGEAEYRNDFRNQALGSIFTRQIVELLNPLIKWVVAVLWRRGLLGLNPRTQAAQIALMRAKGLDPLVIPMSVLRRAEAGKFPLALRFISPAARAMKAESVLGLEALTNYGVTLTNAGVPDVMDNFDTDKAFREYQDLKGAPSKVLRPKDEVKKIRKARQQVQNQQADLQDAAMQADVAQKAARGMKDFMGAQKTA